MLLQCNDAKCSAMHTSQCLVNLFSVHNADSWNALLCCTLQSAAIWCGKIHKDAIFVTLSQVQYIMWQIFAGTLLLTFQCIVVLLGLCSFIAELLRDKDLILSVGQNIAGQLKIHREQTSKVGRCRMWSWEFYFSPIFLGKARRWWIIFRGRKGGKNGKSGRLWGRCSDKFDFYELINPPMRTHAHTSCI